MSKIKYDYRLLFFAFAAGFFAAFFAAFLGVSMAA